MEDEERLLESNNSNGIPIATTIPTSTSTTTTPDKPRYTINTTFSIIAILFAFAFAVGLAIGLGLELNKKLHPSNATQSEDQDKEIAPPTLIIISMDGFRYDYATQEVTPNIIQLANTGVEAPLMFPVFPSKTFPNHYSIVTGLYPESHGIVSNTFYDPIIDYTFRISDPVATGNPRFWGGEPIWNTLEFNGIKTACCFWPGSEAPIQGIRPTYWVPYDGSKPNEERVDLVLEWLSLPLEQRPNFITLYFSISDDYGHQYGPSSPRMKDSFIVLDNMINRLVTGLKELALYDKVNIIITSDHGMTDISRNRVYLLDDFISLSDVEVIEYGPICTLNPVPGKEQAVYDALAKASQTRNFTVYQKDGPNFPPERYHYRNNIRITKIIVVCLGGWSMTNRASYSRNPGSFDGGNHGYDYEFPDMGSTFIAQGPAFNEGVVIDKFLNFEIYNLVATIFGVKPAPNNGTMNSSLIKQALKPISVKSNSNTKTSLNKFTDFFGKLKF